MAPTPEVLVRPQSRIFISSTAVVVAVTVVTLLPLLLNHAGFSFQAPAHSTGWASGNLRLQFDAVTLGLILFIGIAAQVHRRIEARRGVLLLGMALLLAGLGNGIHLVPDRPTGVTHALILARASTAVIILAAVIMVEWARGGRDRMWLGMLVGVIIPVVAAVWTVPAVFGPGPLPRVPETLCTAALVLQLAAAGQTWRLIQQGRLRYFGRGLLLGFIPLIGGQAALLAHLVGHSPDGTAIAVLLQWFAWALPAAGLGIDALLADQDRNLNIEKRFLRDVVDAIPHFVYARDSEGRYTLANTAVAHFFGHEVAEVEGRLLAEIHDCGNDCGAWLQEDRQTLRRGDQWSYPERITGANGQTLDVFSIKRPLEHDIHGLGQVLGVSIDVTDRLKTEQALAERLKMEKTTGAIRTSFVQCTAEDMAPTLNEVLTRVCAFTEAERCYIFRFGPDGEPTERLFVRVEPGDNQPPAPPERFGSGDLLWAANWLAAAAPIDVGGAGTWPTGSAGFRRHFDLQETDGLLAVPIMQRGRLFGLIAVDRRQDTPWRPDSVTMLRNVGDLFITVWDKLSTERNLVDAMEAAQASSRAKTEFLANMSHEIRTPMNCIVGIADLLSEMDPTDEQSQYLEMMRQAGASLLTILNDILDISKIEAGLLELDPVRTELRAVVEEVVGLIAFTAQSRGLEVICRLAPGLPAYGVLDSGRLRQVLTNLLNNAAKFTRRGHIYLDVEPVGGRGPTSWLCFRVTDTGIGIPDEQMQRIFDKFTQAEAGTTRRFGGTGLGLAISRQLVNLMGGELTAESVPDQGSTFTVTIPVVRPEPTLLPDMEAAQDAVLIVAGHELAGEVLVEQARLLGSAASLVMGAPDALTMLAGKPTNGRGVWRAVLVDQSLPVPELQTIAAHCRSLAPVKRPRLWVMTDLAARPRDLTPGVDGYLTKPVRLDRLAAVLGAPPSATAVSMPTHLPVARVDATDADADALGARVLLAEDNPFNQQVAMALLDRLGCDVTVAANGREAVDLVASEEFDLVFMDCQMPVMDGYEATRRIRALAGPGAAVSIVAMTANALSGDRESCFNAGMDDFVAKPITKAMLGAILKKMGLIKSPV